MKKRITKSTVAIFALIVLFSISIFAFVGCDDKETTTESNYLADDTTFSLSLGEGSFGGIIDLLLNKDASYIEMTNDGEFTMLAQLITLNANDLLTMEIGDYTVGDMIAGINLQYYVDALVSQIFPGFTLDDVPTSVELLKDSLGLEITGIDFEDEKIVALLDALKNTGCVPENIELPESMTLGIKLTSTYELKTVYGTDGTEYTAIYVGSHTEKGQPYVVATLSKNDDGEKTFYYRNEVVAMAISGTELAAA